MTMTTAKRLLSLILCAVLAWTVAFGITGCTDDKSPEIPETGAHTTESKTDTAAPQTESSSDDGTKTLGEGAHTFTLEVVDAEGGKTDFTVNTDKTTVGDALMELGLIEGEEGPYGLYVKKVNGITADYDVNGTYWAFYVNGEYAMSGIDLTNIEDGAAYALKVEK